MQGTDKSDTDTYHVELENCDGTAATSPLWMYLVRLISSPTVVLKSVDTANMAILVDIIN